MVNKQNDLYFDEVNYINPYLARIAYLISGLVPLVVELFLINKIGFQDNLWIVPLILSGISFVLAYLCPVPKRKIQKVKNE